MNPMIWKDKIARVALDITGGESGGHLAIRASKLHSSKQMRNSFSVSLKQSETVDVLKISSVVLKQGSISQAIVQLHLSSSPLTNMGQIARRRGKFLNEQKCSSANVNFLPESLSTTSSRPCLVPVSSMSLIQLTFLAKNCSKLRKSSMSRSKWANDLNKPTSIEPSVLRTRSSSVKFSNTFGSSRFPFRFTSPSINVNVLILTRCSADFEPKKLSRFGLVINTFINSTPLKTLTQVRAYVLPLDRTNCSNGLNGETVRIELHNWMVSISTRSEQNLSVELATDKMVSLKLRSSTNNGTFTSKPLKFLRLI